MAQQTIFIPKNPLKYAGDPTRIVARSNWELVYMRALDSSINVAKWMSEPKKLHISYPDPISKQMRRYWPDFLVQYTNNTVEIIEIKPLKEASITEAKSTYDKLMLAKNISKWQAADKLAKSIGGRFRVVTERDLFSPKRPSTKGTKGTKK